VSLLSGVPKLEWPLMPSLAYVIEALELALPFKYSFFFSLRERPNREFGDREAKD
jgi:hypothetical protein